MFLVAGRLDRDADLDTVALRPVDVAVLVGNANEYRLALVVAFCTDQADGIAHIEHTGARVVRAGQWWKRSGGTAEATPGG